MVFLFTHIAHHFTTTVQLWYICPLMAQGWLHYSIHSMATCGFSQETRMYTVHPLVELKQQYVYSRTIVCAIQQISAPLQQSSTCRESVNSGLDNWTELLDWTGLH